MKRGGKIILCKMLLMALLFSLMGQGTVLAKEVVKIRIYTDAPQAQAGTFDLKKNIATLEPPAGHVEITTKDSVLTAKKVIYNQKDDLAELSGDVVITQPDSYARAHEMQADLSAETYILEKNVYLKQLETTEDGDDEVDAENSPSSAKLEVWSNWMEIKDGGKNVLARGDVHLLEAEREAWANELYYDDINETATLVGDVRIETKEGNLLTGAKVIIDLASDEAVMFGPTYGEFRLESDTDGQ